MTDTQERLKRERLHGATILSMNESNWGWHTPAGQIRKERRSEFLTQTNLGKDSNVLEIGCGTGTFTGELSRNFSHLTSIDISEVLLNVARERFPKVKFIEADAHNSGFPSESFDVILGCSVLHHLDWALALKEFKRILKPGGQIRFSEPNLLNPQIYLQKKWKWLKKKMGDSPDEYAFTPFEIKNVLENLDYKNIFIEPFEFLHPLTPVKFISQMIKVEEILESTFLRNIGGSIKVSALK